MRPGEVGRLGGAAPEAVSESLKPTGPSHAAWTACLRETQSPFL